MNRRLAVLLVILSIAAFLRIYRLGAYTEFLGDQGRTGIIIWNAWTNKILPLVGPPVLSGQHLGPFFYYFMAFPFIFSHFHPLAPALWMALFGIVSVLLLFYLSEKLFGLWIGASVSALYAVSPYIVSSDRTLWEPNIVPFFVLLYIFLIYMIHERRVMIAFVPLGFTVGALIQLHYPNAFFFPLSIVFFLYMLFTKKREESARTIVHFGLLGLCTFFILLTPFFYYESFHNWEDIRGIIAIFFSSGSVFHKRQFIYSLSDFSSRLFYTMFPVGHLPTMTVIKLVIIVLAIVQRKFWGLFFGIWFLVGLAAISLYKGVVFDHYLNFLLPLPFFLFGTVAQVGKKRIPDFFGFL